MMDVKREQGKGYATASQTRFYFQRSEEAVVLFPYLGRSVLKHMQDGLLFAWYSLRHAVYTEAAAAVLVFFCDCLWCVCAAGRPNGSGELSYAHRGYTVVCSS